MFLDSIYTSNYTQLLNNIILLLAHCMFTIQFLYSSDIEMLHLLNIPESPTCCGHLGLSGLSWKASIPALQPSLLPSLLPAAASLL